MEMKRIAPLTLFAFLVIMMSGGCGGGGGGGGTHDTYSPDEPSPDEIQNGTAATVLTAEEDSRLKGNLQSRISDILNTETAINHADTFIPGKTYTGTAYYVSAEGDDLNDGLTPSTAWRTLEKVKEISDTNGSLKPGDAVFFRRGDVFRFSEQDPDDPFTIYKTDGVTYSAYGNGEKPVLTGSVENGTGAGKWELVYSDESGKKIWKYYKDMVDIAMIVCGSDKTIATRVYEFARGGESISDCRYESCVLNHYWMNEDPGVTLLGKLLPIEETLTENMTFVSRPLRMGEEMERIEPGPLYFRCDIGNPGTVYDFVEFSQLRSHITLEASRVVFDNLNLRCMGDCFIATFNWSLAENTLIQNCEFAYGGGAVMHYRKVDGTYIIGCVGDSIYCVVRNTTMQNNYIHDCLASAVTYEGHQDAPSMSGNSVYYHLLDNVFVGTLGIRLDASIGLHRDEPNFTNGLAYLEEVIIQGNQVWYTGKLSRGKYYYPEGAFVLMANYYGKCLVENNIFYGTINSYPPYDSLLTLESYPKEDLPVSYTMPQVKNNVYVQYKGGKFASFMGYDGESWGMDDPDVVSKADKFLNDTTSKFYVRDM